MKRIVFILLVATLSAVSLRAQTESSAELPREATAESSRVPPLMAEQVGDLRSSIDPLPYDSLHLPRLNWRGQMPLTMYPYWGWFSGMGNWRLHEGLNMNLGTSVFGSWGDSKYLGTGFSQDISAMYAMPLSKKLSLAMGGFFSNVSFDHGTLRYGGLSGVLSYRFNDRWEAHLYGQKSLMDTNRQMPWWSMGNIGDRIGAGVIYHVSPTFFFEVNVEYHERPAYNVPVYNANKILVQPNNHGAPPPPSPH